MNKWLIVSALKDEISALLGIMRVERTYRQDRAHFYDGTLAEVPVIIGYTGIGTELTLAGLRHLAPWTECDAVIGTGYAGALDPHLATGHIVLTTEVRQSGVNGSAWASDPALVRMCRQFLAEDPNTMEGRLLTSEKALTTPALKQAAAQQYQAIAVDMESASLAAYCQEKQLPFVVLRVILDSAHERVPDPSEFLDRQKRISKRRVLSYMARNPSAMVELPKLGSQAKQAQQRIAALLPKLLPKLNG